MSPDSKSKDDMEPEYDFIGGVRGKYFARYHQISQIRVVESPFLAPPMTGSSGHHADESTVQIGAEPVHQSPRIEVSLPATS